MFKKIKIKFKKFIGTISTSTFIFLLVLPASTNYKLKDYGFGNGGVSNATSANYSLNGIAGEVSGAKSSSAAYKIGDGLIFNSQANVPTAPTFTNPSSYYNKLHLVINTAANPTDTKYAVAISTDNFSTITNYVKSDSTVGATLSLTDYRDYNGWGNTSGINIIGLTANITYQVKVKAMQGKFTETAYSPTASVATVSPTLTFSLSTNAINFGNLNAGSVVDSPANITVGFSTNGETGGNIFVVGKNGGLLSPTKSYTISAVSGNLTALTQGFGAQAVSVTQTSGGPLAMTTAYNQTGNTVAIIDSSVRQIFNTNAPISGGSGVFMFKAKSSSITPAANDYGEVVTVMAAGSF